MPLLFAGSRIGGILLFYSPSLHMFLQYLWYALLGFYLICQ